jgi:glycosyltransferase A (GT-A) superfamily protein (DUF2064 family)
MASNMSSTDKQAIRTWLSVVRAYHLCDAVMVERLAALDVRTAEHEVLANLVRDPGISQQVLAARCFTAKSHISALLRALEERGLVVANSTPRMHGRAGSTSRVRARLSRRRPPLRKPTSSPP